MEPKSKCSPVYSTEVRYLDEGRAQLVNGECVVHVDPIFLECIEPDTPETPWLIHTTSYGEDAKYLYIDQIGIGYFIVKGKGWNGETDINIPFVWTLSATRKGYADIRMEKVEPDLKIRVKSPNPSPTCPVCQKELEFNANNGDEGSCPECKTKWSSINENYPDYLLEAKILRVTEIPHSEKECVR